MLERLESRRFLSVSFTNGALIVTGTSGDDRIELYLKRLAPNGYDDPNIFVRVNNVDQGHFAFGQIKSVRIDALGGNDFVDLQSGAGLGEASGISAHIEGGAGSDTLIGSSGNDTLVGGSHSDSLVGNAGSDLLAGGAGNDHLVSTLAEIDTRFDGDDTLGGGDGNDTLSGAGGADLFQGGRGIDTVDYSARSQNLLINLGAIKTPPLWPVTVGTVGAAAIGALNSYVAQPYPDFNPAALYGTGYLEGDVIQTDVENAVGGSGNDVLWGSAANNILSGGDGNDQIYGGLGYDALYGNNGNDRLFAADDSDNFPTSVEPGTVVPHERLVGGEGHDYAMIDPTDGPYTAKVEKIEHLPYLTS